MGAGQRKSAIIFKLRLMDNMEKISQLQIEPLSCLPLKPAKESIDSNEKKKTLSPKMSDQSSMTVFNDEPPKACAIKRSSMSFCCMEPLSVKHLHWSDCQDLLPAVMHSSQTKIFSWLLQLCLTSVPWWLYESQNVILHYNNTCLVGCHTVEEHFVLRVDIFETEKWESIRMCQRPNYDIWL